MRKLLVAGALVLGFATAAHAQSAEDFYKGKTVTYIVATKPGGGYDDYARLIARDLGKYLSNATVVVENMPGAGHVVGADQLYISKPDGLTIGTFNTSLIFAQLLKQPGVKFDLAKMSWIGKAASDARVLVLSKESGLKSWQDLTDTSKPPFKFAVNGVGSANFYDTNIIARTLHLNVRAVPGFQSSEGEMSMLRGEVVGEIGSESSRQSFVNGGNGFFALEVGGSPQSTIPQATKFVKTDQDRELMAVITAESVIGRLTAGPPGIPADRLALLRTAYMKTLADPDFIAEAKKHNIPIEPADGPETEKIIKDALAQSPETLKLLEEVVKAQ